MEQITEPRKSLRRASSNARSAPPGAKSNAGRLEALIDSLLLRWPNHRKDAAQLVAYHDDLHDLVAECGFERVTSAVRASFTRNSFLPEPSELRELMPSQDRYDQPQWHDEQCEDCHGSGWKLVQVASPFYAGKTETRAVRCPCKPQKKPVAGSRPSFANDQRPKTKCRLEESSA